MEKFSQYDNDNNNILISDDHKKLLSRLNLIQTSILRKVNMFAFVSI